MLKYSFNMAQGRMKAHFLPPPNSIKRRPTRTPFSRVFITLVAACCLMAACGCQSPTTTNSLRVIRMTPASPATLPLSNPLHAATRTEYSSNWVEITLECVITDPGGARVWATPYTNGSMTPGAGSSGSDILPPGTTTVTRSFFIHGETTMVDAIRLLMSDAEGETLFSSYIPVDYLFPDSP